MELRHYLRARNWPVVTGYGLFTGMMAIGYFYNVTFVQLGLVDLGMRVLGMSRQAVATQMAVLALVTAGIALGVGIGMQRRGWSTQLRRKLQLAGGVVMLQAGLTAVAPHIPNQQGLLLWILLCSLALGVGVPATFSLTTDLIPVRDRGYVAAAITAAAYFLANTLSTSWQIGPLSRLLLAMMLPGGLLLGGILLLDRTGRTFVSRWLDELAGNHRRAAFGHGRFLRQGTKRPGNRFWGFVVLMFAIFFIDSLGFLRIIDTPQLVDGAWQAAALTPRLTIAVVHVLAALAAGALYTHLPERHLFYWIFGIFALTHLTYTFRLWLLPETPNEALGAPVLYATAVSLYTVVNFAIWADFATPQTISRQTAIGVSFSGWAATFISTGLAIQWQTSGVSLIDHLQSVNAIAQFFFLSMLIWTLWPPRRRPKTGDENR